MNKNTFFELSYWKSDIPAGVVVFLVALPLCLGVALASQAPLMSGLISGVIGGIIVASFSGSPLSVSGPAAGLAVVVADGILKTGGFTALLAAVVICGAAQILFSVLRLGMVSSFFPSSVIKGMLAAIGIIIVMKQLPHALGRDGDFEGDMSFQQLLDHENTFSELWKALQLFEYGALVTSIVALSILLLWPKVTGRGPTWLKLIPAPLIAIIAALGLNEIFATNFPSLHLGMASGKLVSIPLLSGAADTTSLFIFPALEAFSNPLVWKLGLTMAFIASLETLLSIEATDRLDPLYRVSPVNRELFAQGAGNLVAGLVGGLPITAVIVRSSANIYAGARTRLSAIVHGILLVLAVLLFAQLLNRIPLAALAAILIMVGYKLASLETFRSVYKEGLDQFIPFFATAIAVVFTDILTGVGIGWIFGLFFVIRSNYHSAIFVVRESDQTYIRFGKDVSFLNKWRLRQELRNVAPGSTLHIEGAGAMFVDHDIIELIREFQQTAAVKGIRLDARNLEGKKFSERARLKGAI